MIKVNLWNSSYPPNHQKWKTFFELCFVGVDIDVVVGDSVVVVTLMLFTSICSC